MITGIDDVGDFNPDSNEYNFFVSVSIDQNNNKYQIKESQFELWEKSIPLCNRNQKDEVKGQRLTDMQLESFFYEVININPQILYSVISIKPTEFPRTSLDKLQQNIISALSNVITNAESKNYQSAKTYNKMLGWCKNLNYNKWLN